VPPQAGGGEAKENEIKCIIIIKRNNSNMYIFHTSSWARRKMASLVSSATMFLTGKFDTWSIGYNHSPCPQGASVICRKSAAAYATLKKNTKLK
jgi:hypothetical protein